MSELDETANKLTLKLVYYGPAMSGKTSNLMYLHDVLNPEMKGEMMVLETKNDRTLFFDLLPLGVKAPSGLLVKLKLFTVPGQVAHDSTRKAVLSRADGVVFVADSQISQSTNNAQSFENLADNSARVGIDFDSIPLVVQYNKRDLEQKGLPVMPLEKMQHELNRQLKVPSFSASALSGDGVGKTLNQILKLTLQSLQDEFKWAQ